MKKQLLLFVLTILPIMASADTVEINGIYYNLNTETREAEVTSNPSKYTGEVTIPDKVKYESVDYSVTSIGSQAFSGCYDLTSVTIPNSVTSIRDYAFQICRGLTSVTIPNSVTSIGYEAFSGCSGLTSVTIPNSVTSIGTEAFSACSGLTSIKVESGNPNYDSRNDCNAIIETSSNTLIAGCKNTIIPNSVTSIGEGAFAWCYGLTSVTIPNSVTSISNYAFRYCSGLTSMTIPNSVTSIGQRAFESCDGLTSVTIPNSVTSIGEGAFSWCSGLTEVSIDLTTPLAIDDYTFSDRANTTLYVPAGSKAAYEAADYWKEFKEIIEKEASKVKLSKTKVIIEKGKTLTLKSKVYPTTEDQSVTWKSSDKNVATVTKAGKVKAVGVGTAKITCTSVATGAKATCKVTVGYVKLSKTEVTIEKGKTLTLKSKVYPTTEDQSVTWESSDPTIVKVTASGKIGGLKAGTATITCTSVATGLSATCEVTVGYVKLSKTEVTIQKGKSLTLKSKVYPTTLDQTVTWESSDPTIVKVTSSGKIGGFKVGTATITCTSLATGLSATCIVTVTAAANARSLNGEVTGIDDMDVDPAAVEPFDVYDLNGRKVLHQVTSLDALPDGVYIVNGRKVMKKD